MKRNNGIMGIFGGGGEVMHTTQKEETTNLDALFWRRWLLRSFYVLELFLIFPSVVGRALGPLVLVLAGTWLLLVKRWQHLESSSRHLEKFGKDLEGLENTWKSLVKSWTPTIILLFFSGLALSILAGLSLLGYHNLWPGTIRYCISNQELWWTGVIFGIAWNSKAPSWLNGARFVIVLCGTLATFAPAIAYDWALWLETVWSQGRNARPAPVKASGGLAAPGGDLRMVAVSGAEDDTGPPQIQSSSSKTNIPRETIA